MPIMNLLIERAMKALRSYSAQGMNYEQAEPHLRQSYEEHHGSGKVGWDKAKHAARDAWERVERAIPGDADHDGK